LPRCRQWSSPNHQLTMRTGRKPSSILLTSLTSTKAPRAVKCLQTTHITTQTHLNKSICRNRLPSLQFIRTMSPIVFLSPRQTYLTSTPTSYSLWLHLYLKIRRETKDRCSSPIPRSLIDKFSHVLKVWAQNCSETTVWSRIPYLTSSFLQTLQINSFISLKQILQFKFCLSIWLIKSWPELKRFKTSRWNNSSTKSSSKSLSKSWSVKTWMQKPLICWNKWFLPMINLPSQKSNKIRSHSFNRLSLRKKNTLKNWTLLLLTKMRMLSTLHIARSRLVRFALMSKILLFQMRPSVLVLKKP
jgi:hypothetical protein